MREPIIEPWGKLNRESGEWHPLVDHCIDVAACAEALLGCTGIGARLSVLGIDPRDEATRARLSLIAGLHDIGKCCVGFQNKGTGRGETSGHVGEAVAAGMGVSSYAPGSQATTEIRRLVDEVEGILGLSEAAEVSHAV